MKDLKPQTVSRFKKIYEDYHELIEYRIKSGSIYEKAQATLIKNVAVGALEMPSMPQQLDILQNASQRPLSKRTVTNDSDYTMGGLDDIFSF